MYNTASVFDNREIKEVTCGEVVRVKKSSKNRYGEKEEIYITLSTGYNITIPEEIIKEAYKLLEVTA